jgi:DNA-binding LacI/PurR family transcriptional regulator
VSTQVRSGKGTRAAPTLEEVAARAGVSRATASRVLRGDKKVSEHARTVVLEAAEAISYVPNLAARSLVTGRSDSVAFLVEESEERMFSDPFFLGMLRSAQESIAEAGLQLVFTVVNRPEDQSRFLSYAAGGHVDGVLLLSLHDDDTLPELVRSRGLPVVLGGRATEEQQGPYVDADNALGARLAVDHLVQRGRQHIATIAGPADMVVGRTRHDGYLAGLRAAGIEADADMVVRGDLMAAGALRVLREAGRRVPDDVSVVGFDDAPLAQSTHPPLTTVHQSPEQMGREMVTLLLDTMHHPDEPPGPRLLETRLVVRESS